MGKGGNLTLSGHLKVVLLLETSSMNIGIGVIDFNSGSGTSDFQRTTFSAGLPTDLFRTEDWQVIEERVLSLVYQDRRT